MGSLVHDKDVITFVCDDALDDEGYVLTFGSEEGHVRKAGYGELALGVALKDTKDVITGVVQSGVPVGVIKFRSGLVVKLKLESDNQAIAYGDPLAVTSDVTEKGCVDKRDGTNETGPIIAYALEAVTSNAGGTIEAILR